MSFILKSKRLKMKKTNPKVQKQKEIHKVLNTLGRKSNTIQELRNQFSLVHREWTSYYLDQEDKVWKKRNEQMSRPPPR